MRNVHMALATVLGFLCVLLFSGFTALSQTTPGVINYQGRLTDNTPQQNPISGTVAMEFRIYDAQVGGTLLWSETWSSVQVNNGFFSVLLGSQGTPIPDSVFTGGVDRYLEIVVNGEVLTPRQRIGKVGYSVQSEKSADTAKLGGIGPSGWQRTVSPSTCGPNAFFYSIQPDGTANCATPTESDPQVGTLSTNRVPRWNGSQLVDGIIYDNTSGVAVGGNPMTGYVFGVYGSMRVTSSLTVGGRVIGVATPVQSTDAANKAYVDARDVVGVYTINFGPAAFLFGNDGETPRFATANTHYRYSNNNNGANPHSAIVDITALIPQPSGFTTYLKTVKVNYFNSSGTNGMTIKLYYRNWETTSYNNPLPSSVTLSPIGSNSNTASYTFSGNGLDLTNRAVWLYVSDGNAWTYWQGGQIIYEVK